MIWIPIVAALTNAMGLGFEKVALAKKRMPNGLYLSVLFLIIFFITSLMSPFLGAIDHALVFKPKYIILFVTALTLGIMYNYLMSVSIQKEKLHEHEMIMMLSPVLTIVLASLYTPASVDFRVFVAAFVAAVCLLIAKLEKGHFDFSRYSINLVIAVFMMAVESLIINELLKAYSPISLYAFRTGFMFLAYVLIFRPHFNLMSRDNFKLVVGSAVMGSIYMVLRLYGYKDFGIVKTTLFLVASPILVYLISARYFKEKISWKTGFASIVILGCIVYVSFIAPVSH